jgi:hypothetical protein
MDDLGEPPPPPRLVRTERSEYNPMRRRPSSVVPDDGWISQFMRSPREIFESTQDINAPSWWGSVPERLKTDHFWKHMFAQPDFFLIEKKIETEKRDAIDTIMGLLSIGYKGMYETRRGTPLKNPLPNVVNVSFVKHYLKNVTPLRLTSEDRYRFEMMIMNFLMFAPMDALEGYIDRLTRRGGKRRTRRRKNKVV